MTQLFKRIIKAGWKSFSRDGGLAIANIFILVMTLFLISSLFLLKDTSRFLISKIEEKADISVYFKDEISEEEIFAVKEKVAQIPEVKETEYVSREQALDSFVQKHKDDVDLMKALEEVGGNPFVASLNIQAWQASQYEAISKFFEKPEFQNMIEKIDYSERKPLIESIFGFTSTISKAGMFVAFILVIISILVTFNTIRLSILNFSQEISIQRLVGASNWFIRGPFIIQGIIYGFLAAVICFLFFGLLSWSFSSKIETLFPGLNILAIFVKNIWPILLVQVIGGMILGAISSLIALRKYLKV